MRILEILKVCLFFFLYRWGKKKKKNYNIFPIQQRCGKIYRIKILKRSFLPVKTTIIIKSVFLPVLFESFLFHLKFQIIVFTHSIFFLLLIGFWWCCFILIINTSLVQMLLFTMGSQFYCCYYFILFKFFTQALSGGISLESE